MNDATPEVKNHDNIPKLNLYHKLHNK